MPNVSRTNVRASSWGALFDCAYKWEWETLLGHRKPSGLRAALGTALHASTAVYDQAVIDEAPVRASDAAAVLIEKLFKPEYDVDLSQDELSLGEAEKIGLILHTRYCHEISARMNYAEVETDLEPLEIDCGSGTIVVLTGKMDRARVAKTDTGGFVIPDLKSGKSVIEKGEAKIKGRSAQIGTYQLLYENTRDVITEGGQVIALSTTSKPALAVSKVFDAKRVMVGAPGERGLIEWGAEMFRSGFFPPNPQSNLCNKKYCARWEHCSFHE
jgi:PD-(D/E)XK nuclease superfamily